MVSGSLIGIPSETGVCARAAAAASTLNKPEQMMFLVSILRFLSLERKARRTLDHARTSAFRRLNVGYCAECCRVEGGIRRCVICMIKQVRGLRPNLEPQAFANLDRFHQRHGDRLRSGTVGYAHR